jgi:hypothetical protein
MSEIPSKPGATDVAALSGAIVAVAVSLFVTPGEYSLINLIFSVTLLAVAGGFVLPHARTTLQSISVATALGLASLPAVGFVYETAYSRDPWQHLIGTYEWTCKDKLDPCSKPNEDGDARSRVNVDDIALGWLIVTFIAFTGDRIKQRINARQKMPRD